MTGRRRLGLVAAGATLLSAAPLSAIFDSWTWLLECVVAVGIVAGAALLARTLRAPLWAQIVGMVAALLLVLTWMFPSGDELLALLPTPATFTWFGELIAEAGTDTRSYGVPVPDRQGLLFVTVLGVGAVAIVVDLLTVGLRRPALAGLPMLAIYSVPVAVYVDSVPVTPFVIGATGFLWLLVSDNVDRVRRFGRRFTGDGRDVDVWEPSPLAAAGRRLAVLGVAAAVVVPLAVPGITGGLLSQLTAAGGAGGTGTGTGSGTGNGRVNLFATLSGDLNKTATTELLRVTTNEPDPYYLRFGVADVVTAAGFSYRESKGSPVTRDLPDPRVSAEGVSYQRYRATVEVTGNFNMPYAPVYSSIVSTNLDDNWRYDDEMQVVYSPRASTRDKKYEFEYVRAKFPPAALRTAKPMDRDDPALVRLIQVPRDDRVDGIVSRLTRDKTTDFDKVAAIYQFFAKANGFSYQLQTESGTSGSDIGDFLINKVGFCQQYAAAMAWMARAAGIPARVAFGFTQGEARTGGTAVLTNRNLHAWTEVYLTGFGWIPFDATPRADVVGSARTEWAPDNDQVVPAPSASASSAAPGTDPSAAPAGPAGSTSDFNDRDAGTLDTGTTTSTTSRRSLLIAGLVALVLVLLTVPAVRRSVIRRRRHTATSGKAEAAALGAGPPVPGSPDVVVTTEAVRARQDAHAAWDELVDTMVDYRVTVDPTETPRHTAERLVRDVALTGDPAEAATLLGRAEERARYARAPLQGGELIAALGQVRRALAGASDRRTRTVALLFPPSVMQRWRLGVAERSSRLIRALSRQREAAARWNPRRLLARTPR